MQIKKNVSATKNIMVNHVPVEDENPSQSVSVVMEDGNIPIGCTAPISSTGTFLKGCMLAILIALVLLGGYMLFPAPNHPTMAEKFLDGYIQILINILYYFK